MKRELTQTEVGYLAGLFDGEGCISILKMRERRIYTHYAVQVRIGNTSLPLLDWVQERVGGRVYAQRYKTWARGNRKQQYHWHLGGKNAVPFLELVRPYLVVKGPQADLALRFLTLGSERAPSARADLREQMRLLNFRGIGEQNGDSAASVTQTPMAAES